MHLRPLAFVALSLIAAVAIGCSDNAITEDENTLERCQDGIDNDANSLIDCADPGCTQFTFCQPNPGLPPQKYHHGIQPSLVKDSLLFARYAQWLADYYEEDSAGSGMARVRFDTRAHTVSEGIAYGMLITVALDPHADRFDKLWAYYRHFSNSRGVMHWKINGFENVVSQNAATDAELDAAVALIVADRRWGVDRTGVTYRHWAEDLIAKIKEYEVSTLDNLLKPGDSWSSPVNPSYVSGAALRLFAQFTNDPDWLTITAANYALLARCQHPTNGLHPDWCLEDGSANTSNPTRFKYDFSYDAVRTPWRIGWDYLWYGAPEAAALNQISLDWIIGRVGNSISGIYTEYSRDGVPKGSAGGALGIGAFCFAATHSPAHQEWLDRCYWTLQEIRAASYFTLTLQVIYMSILSGHLQQPTF